MAQHRCIYSPNCPEVFSLPREALNHALAEHVRYKADPNYDFTCRIPNCACGGATFEKRDGIVTHLTLKANIYDVGCERNCGRMFKRTSEMRTHLKKCQGGTAPSGGSGNSRLSGGTAGRSVNGESGGGSSRRSIGKATVADAAGERNTLPPSNGTTGSSSVSSMPQPPQKTTLVVNGATSKSASPSTSPRESSSVPVSSLVNGPMPTSNPNSPKRAPASPLKAEDQPPSKKVRAWIGKIGKWVDVDVITESQEEGKEERKEG